MKNEKKQQPENLPAIDLIPIVDIVENDDGYILQFEIPGANSESVSIKLDNSMLSIEAASSLRRQGRKIRFVRHFHLNNKVDSATVTAKVQDGVLLLTVPKSPEAKTYKIQVS